MTDRDFDIIIVGGGPVGMALALALREYEFSILLLEARGLPENVDDPRPLALSYGSHLILQRLGIWENLAQPTPIKTIHISNRDHFGHTVLTPDEAGVPALGYVVNYHNLYHVMSRAVQNFRMEYRVSAEVSTIRVGRSQAQVTYQHDGKTGSARTGLLVLADGGRLADHIGEISYHVHDYRQHAIVANVEVESPQPGTAFERFTLDGPLALLPSGNGYALVWTVSSDAVEKMLRLDDETFLSRLQEHFGERMGNFFHTGKRSGFPLMLKHASAITSQRTVLIGNAAQTLHPVAGQGFNLGLRDAWELADEISCIPPGIMNELGSARMLAAYSRRRQLDGRVGRLFTDSLIRLFTTDFPLLQASNGAGLSLLDCLPPVKRLVSRQMIFGTKGWFVG